VDENIWGETRRMNINEYSAMVRFHHETLNKKCENHISDCMCNDCLLRAESAQIIRMHKNQFIGFTCKCKECSK